MFASWAPLGGPLGALLGRLGGVVGRLEAILDRRGVTRAVSTLSWTIWALCLGSSWAVLGLSGGSGEPPGALADSWAVLERRETEKARTPKSFNNFWKSCG